VEPRSGTVVVSGPLSWDYVTVSYFQIQANNTQASYHVQKTAIGTTSFDAVRDYIATVDTPNGTFLCFRRGIHDVGNMFSSRPSGRPSVVR